MSDFKLYGRVFIRGTITAKTGLHIGGSEGAITIGGVDNTVIRDPLSGRPYIPGSSLKGKMRSLTEKSDGLEARQGKRDETAAIHREETQGKTCIDCHENLVHRHVTSQETFKRAAWNQMIEEEFGLLPGTAERLLAD